MSRTIHMEIQLESSQATFLLLGIYNSGAETVCQDANSVKNFCRQVSSNWLAFSLSLSPTLCLSLSPSPSLFPAPSLFQSFSCAWHKLRLATSTSTSCVLPPIVVLLYIFPLSLAPTTSCSAQLALLCGACKLKRQLHHQLHVICISLPKIVC